MKDDLKDGKAFSVNGAICAEKYLNSLNYESFFCKNRIELLRRPIISKRKQNDTDKDCKRNVSLFYIICRNRQYYINGEI